MPRRPGNVTLMRGALRIAAALLLVDGRVLPTDELARMSLPWGGSRTSLGWWVMTLRRAGLKIETMDFHGSGYRLLAIPPDDVLDDVLTHARELQTEHPTRPWELFGRPMATSPSPAAHSPASSARRSA